MSSDYNVNANLLCLVRHIVLLVVPAFTEVVPKAWAQVPA